MQKKIYVTGLDDDVQAAKVDAAVRAVNGVVSVVASVAKCQVLVDFDGKVSGIEAAINAAISSVGMTVLA